MHPIGENSPNVPAFLSKLWAMVNDPNTDHLVCWSPAENSFVIQNQAQFWYELLPLYYKHNNMSSFVRQLNMYGFHKMSTIESGTMDADKDEIQFYHPYFQKDQPELLKNIKRKVTVSKPESNVQNVWKHDDIAKVLTDVKQLRGRQSSVDSQLSAMKQENAVLWRELAMLRQKHIKQQQIVNKLIQFLVTLVQPSASSRIGVGVKRRIPLMLHENPSKKMKAKKNVNDNTDGGPTIHELDSEIDMSSEKLFEDSTNPPLVSSPLSSTSTQTQTGEDPAPPLPYPGNENAEPTVSDVIWEKPTFGNIENVDDILPGSSLNAEGVTDSQLEANVSNEKVFLNTTGKDTLLSNLINGSYNSNVLNGKNKKKMTNLVLDQIPNQSANQVAKPNSDMTVATRDLKINNGDDFDLHLDSAQSEIDQFKDLLNGCNSLDANALLGLFNDQPPAYGLSLSNQNSAGDPLLSGTEVTPYGLNFIDFNELLDDSMDAQSTTTTGSAMLPDASTSIETPLIGKSAPVFPNVEENL